jgi:hypothetical protein
MVVRGVAGRRLSHGRAAIDMKAGLYAPKALYPVYLIQISSL